MSRAIFFCMFNKLITIRLINLRVSLLYVPLHKDRARSTRASLIYCFAVSLNEIVDNPYDQ